MTCVDVIQNVMEQQWENKRLMISLFYKHKQNLEVCKENIVNEPKNTNTMNIVKCKKKVNMWKENKYNKGMRNYN